MPDLQPSESSPPSGATPPPLPHKVFLFKLGWRLGFWFGIMQVFFLLLAFVLFLVSPGGPPPLAILVAVAGAALQTFSAYAISKYSAGGRTLFSFSTICAFISYLPTGFFIFGLLNFVPLLLVIAGSSPDVAPKTQEGGPIELSRLPSATEEPSPKEDLY